MNREAVLKEKINKLEQQHDIYWKQRAHVNWLKEGDKNTSYFHAFASDRRRKNTIKRLRKEDGGWVEGQSNLKGLVHNYFSDLFTSSGPADNTNVTRYVLPKVDRQMNQILCAEYSREEVKSAIDDIGDLKAPGPDGMPALFYKRFWHIVGEKVIAEVLKVLKGGDLPLGWNDTMVVLIPKNKRRGKKGYAALKLDMSKAYDRVEWAFLHDMLMKLGFDRRWISLVMKCVTTVKYQIKINHDITDDSLLLMKAEASNALEIERILKTYAACSGQVINTDKSAIMFSKNTPDKDKQEVMGILQLRRETRSEKYLGLPVFIGKSKSRVFEYLKEKVWKRIQGWKERMLSNAGKEILIKAVAQAIPIYAMACFDITKTLCDQMSTMICRYW